MSQTFYKDLRWYKLLFTLQNIRSTRGQEHPLSIFQSVIKNITNGFLHYEKCSLIFHVPDLHFSQQIVTGGKYQVELLFFGHKKEVAERWSKEASLYFHEPAKRNFLLVEMGTAVERSAQSLLENAPFPPEDEEVCLNFHAPLPFTPAFKKRRFFITEKSFLNLYRRRLETLFGKSVSIPEIKTERFQLLPYYWDFQSVKHPSRSSFKKQGVSQVMIRGCVGRLYIKGDLREIWPLLVMGSEIHTGGRMSYSYGYYKLETSSPPFFASALQNRELFLSFSKTVMEESDKRFESYDEEREQSDDERLQKIWNQVEKGKYSFSPNQAFTIKKEGGERIIENLSLEDYLVQRFLLKIIHKTMDRLFEESSMGYRKGKSVDTVFQRIEELLLEGYHYIFESDVEDFFPSIDPDRVEALLTSSLPGGDAPLINLLKKAIRNPFILKNRIRERSRGLALGSPLSPLLTNLYLDSFDEHFLQEGSVLLRYSDDFIVMCKEKEDAEKAALRSKLALEEAGLKPKEAKTQIIHYDEGFHFLGRRFSPENNNPLAPEISGAMKKPLYITEPFLFLSLEGEAVALKKGTRIFQTFPLRRIESIIVLERASFSSNLVRRCVDLKIPITFTMNSGYFVTTITPDSKSHYSILTSHGSRFSSLSQAEKLWMAQQFAKYKLYNYRAFFKLKRRKSNEQYYPLQNLIEDLLKGEEKIGECATVAEIRGTEGAMAKKVFAAHNHLINNQDFHFQRRNRKEGDPINSLFNFGYYLLFTRLNTLVRAAGLNPYLGVLHSEADRYESFTCDIEELFRVKIDQFLITLINLKVVSAGDFEKQSKGLFLKREKKRLFLELFERNMEQRNSRGKKTLIQAMEEQVKTIKDWAVQGTPLEFYKWEET